MQADISHIFAIFVRYIHKYGKFYENKCSEIA